MEYEQYFIDKLIGLPIKRKLDYVDNLMYHDIFIHDKDWRVRDAIAKCGSDEYRELLADDENEKVRMSAISPRRNDIDFNGEYTRSFHDVDYRMDIAENGPDKYRDLLVYDPVWQVREIIARYGTDKHRDILVYDPSPRVRAEVAIHGNDDHRGILIKDPVWQVRYAIIYYGSKEHVEILTKDEDSEVAVEAMMRFSMPSWWHKD